MFPIFFQRGYGIGASATLDKNSLTSARSLQVSIDTDITDNNTEEDINTMFSFCIFLMKSSYNRATEI